MSVVQTIRSYNAINEKNKNESLSKIAFRPDFFETCAWWFFTISSTNSQLMNPFSVDGGKYSQFCLLNCFDFSFFTNQSKRNKREAIAHQEQLSDFEYHG